MEGELISYCTTTDHETFGPSYVSRTVWKLQWKLIVIFHVQSTVEQKLKLVCLHSHMLAIIKSIRDSTTKLLKFKYRQQQSNYDKIT